MSLPGQWAKTLPPSWEAKPLKAVATCFVSSVDKIPEDGERPVRLCNYTDVYNHEFITLGLDFMQSTATADEARKFGLQVNDVVITKDSESWDDIAVPALVKETADDLVCGYHLAVLRPMPQQMHGPYLLRCLQAKSIRVHLELASTGVTRFGLPKDEIGKVLLPVPPLPQQRAIAEYLDHETARVDALVAAKKRLLGQLAEKRRSLVTHAVTRGLNSNTPLRDSGIPWLGQIPAHWPLFRAKFLWREQSLPVRDEDEMVTCFRDGQVTLRKNRREEGFTNAVKELGYQGIRSGQLVLHSMDAFAGAIGVSDSEGKCTPEYIICNAVRDDVFNPYFGFLLRVMALNGFIQASCTAVRERAPRIHFSDFGDMFFPLPPVGEQRAIIAHIAAETAKVDKLRVAAERTIALLKERRAALIAAAVTGKMSVRGSPLAVKHREGQ